MNFVKYEIPVEYDEADRIVKDIWHKHDVKVGNVIVHYIGIYIYIYINIYILYIMYVCLPREVHLLKTFTVIV